MFHPNLHATAITLGSVGIVSVEVAGVGIGFGGTMGCIIIGVPIGIGLGFITEGIFKKKASLFEDWKKEKTELIKKHAEYELIAQQNFCAWKGYTTPQLTPSAPPEHL